MKNLFILTLVGFLFTSCIPTKDLTYFQGEPKERKSIHKVQQAPYRLQINDIVDVKIKSTNDEMVSFYQNDKGTSNISESQLYFNSYSVDKNGMIRVPYLNDINVLGFTTKEVRLKIERELAKMFKDMSSVYVSVKLAGIRYTVVGEVNNTGVKVLYQNQVNIIEAIANAGDIKMTGNRRNVTVIRKTIDGVKKMQLDLTGFDFMDSEGFYIQPNDIISIEPLKQKSWGTGETGTKTISTIITSLSLITTTIILIRNL